MNFLNVQKLMLNLFHNISHLLKIACLLRSWILSQKNKHHLMNAQFVRHLWAVKFYVITSQEIIWHDKNTVRSVTYIVSLNAIPSYHLALYLWTVTLIFMWIHSVPYTERKWFHHIVRLLAAVRLKATSLYEALSSQSFGHRVVCLRDVFERRERENCSACFQSQLEVTLP